MSSLSTLLNNFIIFLCLKRLFFIFQIFDSLMCEVSSVILKNFTPNNQKKIVIILLQNSYLSWMELDLSLAGIANLWKSNIHSYFLYVCIHIFVHIDIVENIL